MLLLFEFGSKFLAPLLPSSSECLIKFSLLLADNFNEMFLRLFSSPPPPRNGMKWITTFRQTLHKFSFSSAPEPEEAVEDEKEPSEMTNELFRALRLNAIQQTPHNVSIFIRSLFRYIKKLFRRTFPLPGLT
jgi:hypothetical protein